MAQNFIFGEEGPLRLKTGFYNPRYSLANLGSDEAQQLNKIMENFKNRPNWTFWKDPRINGQLRNALTNPTYEPNFTMGPQTGATYTSASRTVNPKVAGLLTDKLISPTTANTINTTQATRAIDYLKPFKDIGGAIGKRAPWLGPLSSLAAAISFSKPISNVTNYATELGNYFEENDPGLTDLKGNIKKFNTEYAEKNKDLMDKALVALYGGTDKGQKNIPSGSGEALPPLPNIPSNLPIVRPEIPQNVDVMGILREAGETPITQAQPAQGRSVDDLIEQARALHEQRQNLLNPDTEALRGLIENYSKNRGSDFYRDLGLAGLAGLTNNQAYAQMIGRYGTTEDELKKYQLQRQLTEQELGQVFNPMEIIANAALMERLGLPTEAALANKDILNNYAKLIGYDVNKDIAERKLAESIRQHNEKMAQRKYEFENPNYNLRASQMQAIGSLLNAATIDPAIRDMVRSPQFLDYVQKTIGFSPKKTPNSQPTSELDAAAQRVKTRGTFGGN